MNYPDSVEFLYALGNEYKSFKLGLEAISRLVEALGNPQRRFRVIHVAGTNGKGSTCALMDSSLRAAGYRTGLYTSPHLVEPTERIQVGGRAVSSEQFAAAFAVVHEVSEELVRKGELPAHPTYFETVTAMGFVLFRDLDVDVAVVEVGLGGRLDATNVVEPELCVITPIDFDHERWLGSSLEAIAGEKAGILKTGVPAVFAAQRWEAERVLQAKAEELGCPVIRAQNIPCKVECVDAESNEITLDGVRLHVPFAGEHQIVNATTAFAALRHLGVPAQAIEKGFAQARWPGRLEVVSERPRVLLDGAHNPAGARVLAAHIRRFYHDRKRWIVYGAMRDKSV
ncbi:MAG TPA: folylpolyglutamate synthase/dihydrofolate synthase family protein, partial [Bryobacteraceae bacterium]|nr:folylpolyglutamate synthase/dihydrofolate synthase family protein [Bryobacteraceae bacterium]